MRALGVVDGFTIWFFIFGLLKSGVLHGASLSYFGPSFLVYSNLEFFMGHLQLTHLVNVFFPLVSVLSQY